MKGEDMAGCDHGYRTCTCRRVGIECLIKACLLKPYKYIIST